MTGLVIMANDQPVTRSPFTVVYQPARIMPPDSHDDRCCWIYLGGLKQTFLSTSRAIYDEISDQVDISVHCGAMV